MATVFKCGRIVLPATCLALLFAIGAAVWPQSQTFSFTVAGQSMIRSDFRVHTPNEVTTISPLLKGDVIFTNFEATVVEKGQSLQDGRFLSPPEALDALKALGFNLLALSDNHSFDLKVSGIQNTLREVKSRHIVHAGIGNKLEEATAPGYLKTQKGTVALVAMASGLIAEGGSATTTRPGVNELRIEAGGKPNESTTLLPAEPGNEPNTEDKQRILGSIREARQHADFVVRLVPGLKKWTHEEIDAGADIIVMHGAPLLHGVEIYHGRPIFYDLGNFIYNTPPTLTYIDEPMSWESVVAYVEFQGKNVKSISLRPIALNVVGEGQPDIHNEYTNNQFLDTRGLPAPATGSRAGYILQRLADASKPFGTRVEVKGETGEIKLKAGS